MRKLNYIYKIRTKKQIVYCRVANELNRVIVNSACDGCYFLGKFGCTVRSLASTCADDLDINVYKRSML